MSCESYSRPAIFDIAVSEDNMAVITFAENVEQIQKTHKAHKPVTNPRYKGNSTDAETTEQDEAVTVFVYDKYTITVPNREGLAEDINNNLDKWLEFVKEQDYDTAAAKIRAKRDKLLAETDKEFALDRLNLEIPEKLTTATLLSGVKSVFEGLADVLNNDMAKYRQALRDIPQQAGFPYNVVFPNKPQ